jgi:ADP-ribose pyrophosphatase YjhB (NUDIX family)
MREAWEEARARIAIEHLLAVYNVPRISQVQLIYRATLREGTFAAGEESLEVALFEWDDLPWQDLAFPSVLWALRHFDEVRGMASFAPRGNPPDDAAAY